MSLLADGVDLESGSATRDRRPLREIVPFDVLRSTRITLMISYGIFGIWWFKYRGMVWDRISVALALFIFLVCAFVGRSWRQWAILGRDVALYSVMWLAYEITRGAADGDLPFGITFPLQVQAARNIDRFMFLGHDMSVVLQHHLWHTDVRWYDKVASCTYMTHFVVAPIVMGVLWATNHREWVRFMKRFATVLLVSCALFIVMPTAPPWMTANRYHVIDHIQRGTGRGFSAMGFTAFVGDYHNSLDWGNAVAAMPSLHSAFALMVPAFFLPRIGPVWLKVLVLCFPVLMLTSLVYFGEHWVIDGLVGWALVGGSFAFWGRRERRVRELRAATARTALA